MKWSIRKKTIGFLEFASQLFCVCWVMVAVEEMYVLGMCIIIIVCMLQWPWSELFIHLIWGHQYHSSVSCRDCRCGYCHWWRTVSSTRFVKPILAILSVVLLLIATFLWNYLCNHLVWYVWEGTCACITLLLKWSSPVCSQHEISDYHKTSKIWQSDFYKRFCNLALRCSKILTIWVPLKFM